VLSSAFGAFARRHLFFEWIVIFVESVMDIAQIDICPTRTLSIGFLAELLAQSHFGTELSNQVHDFLIAKVLHNVARILHNVHEFLLKNYPIYFMS
jgi:hypothetical protein